MDKFRGRAKTLAGSHQFVEGQVRDPAVLDRLGAELDILTRSLVELDLEPVARRVAEAFPVVVGKQWEVGTGGHLGPVLKLLHEEALATSYVSVESASLVREELVRQCRVWPEAHEGAPHSTFVVIPGEGDEHRIKRSHQRGSSRARLTRKRPPWSRAVNLAAAAAEREAGASAVKQGLQVDGRELHPDPDVEVRADEHRGYGVATGDQCWRDTGSEEYKASLEKHIRDRRWTEFGDAPDWAVDALVHHLRTHSKAYWQKGAKPTRLRGHLVEWDIDPLVPPMQAQARKKSPAMADIERKHILRERSYGNLEPVPPGENCEWASPVDLVVKPGEDPPLGAGGEGRLVCDYRHANTATRAKAGAMTSSWEMLREAASAAILTVLDAYSGFSHLVLSKAVQKLLTIITSLGLMRWTTMPFGPKNAPPEFQEAINSVFRELIPGYVRIFVDDLCARSGRWRKGSKPLQDRKLVKEHIELLDRVATIAIREGLMFKFPKGQFLKVLVELVGFAAGQGRIQVTEKRCSALVGAPRPRTVGELASYLGALGLIRNMLPPDYSEVAGELRELIKSADPQYRLAPASLTPLRKSERDAVAKAGSAIRRVQELAHPVSAPKWQRK